MSDTSSDTHDNDTPSAPPIRDIVEVSSWPFGKLAYTVKLIIPRTAGLVGGSLLPERPLLVEVKEHSGNRLAFIVHDQAVDNLRNLIDNTPFGHELERLFHKCYLAWQDERRGKATIKEELELTAEQSAQLSQAILLLLVNYSNRPLSELTSRS